MKKVLECVIYFVVVVFVGLFSWYFIGSYYEVLDLNYELREEAILLGIMEESGDIDLSSVYLKKSELEDQLIEKYGTIVFSEIDLFIRELRTSNDLVSGEILDINKRIGTLNEKVAQLNLQYEVLKNKREKMSKQIYLIDNVFTFDQYPNYPTGCESVALSILLEYYGVDVTVDDLIQKLPKGDLPYYKDNILYGGNPYLEFIGDPYSKESFGTFDVPIYKVAIQYKSGMINGTGNDLDTVLDIVSQGRPVLVWTSMYLALPYISKSWIYPVTNEVIHWPANEHAVVIVGFSEDYVVISDPIGGEIKYQDRGVFEERYNYYGRRNLYY